MLEMPLDGLEACKPPVEVRGMMRSSDGGRVASNRTQPGNERQQNQKYHSKHISRAENDKTSS